MRTLGDKRSYPIRPVFQRRNSNQEEKNTKNSILWDSFCIHIPDVGSLFSGQSSI
jgi:hypothetical protein